MVGFENFMHAVAPVDDDTTLTLVPKTDEIGVALMATLTASGTITSLTSTTTSPHFVISATAQARAFAAPTAMAVISPVLGLTPATTTLEEVQMTAVLMPGSPETTAEPRAFSLTKRRMVSGDTKITVGSFARSRTVTFAVADFASLPSQHVTVSLTSVSPTLTPVTTPEALTVAIAGEAEDHVT